MDLTKLNFHESDKLAGARNYLIWAYRVERIFRSYKLWDLIVPPAPVAGATPLTAAEMLAKEDRIEKCLNIYSFTVTTTLIPSIRRMGSDPAEVWTKLKKRFESAAEQRKMDLREELNNLKMDEGMTVEQFLMKLDLIVIQLADIDEDVDDKALIHVVLKGLPSSWSAFKSTFGTLMAHSGTGTTLTFSDLEMQLQAEEFRHAAADTAERALAVSHRQHQQLNQRPFTQAKKKSSNRSSTKQKGTSSDNSKRTNFVVCSHCGRRNHKVEQCEIKEIEQQL